MAEAGDRSGAVDTGPGIRLAPGLYFFATTIAGFAVDRWVLPSPHLPGWLVSQAGLFVLALGAAMLLASIAALLSARTTIDTMKPSRVLVTRGMYGLSRNPIYLSLTVVCLGVSLLGDCVWALALLPLAIFLIDSRVIPREEDYLRREFGGAYPAYAGRVRRWL